MSVRRDIRPARTRLTIESLGAAAAAAAACKQVLLTHRLRGRVPATGLHQRKIYHVSPARTGTSSPSLSRILVLMLRPDDMQSDYGGAFRSTIVLVFGRLNANQNGNPDGIDIGYVNYVDW